MNNLSFNDLPFGWALCFQSDCPLAGRCLRHRGGTLLPEGTLACRTVNPHLRTADGCKLFVAAEPVQMAYGMTGLDHSLNVIEAKELHEALYDYFGSRSRYYRFRNCRDDRPRSVSGISPVAEAEADEVGATRHTFGISPQQQADIAAIFRRLGLKGEPRFDHYEARYFFPEP